MSNEDEVIDDGLTDEERALDAQMIAAELGPVFVPMIQARREKAAKSGNRKKKVDRRFKLNAVDAGVASPNTAKSEDPWDAQQIDYEEFQQIIQVERPYMVHVNGDFQWAPNANKDRMFDEIFKDRARTPANLLRLHRFLCLKHKGGFPSFEGGLLHQLVVKILVTEGLIEEPVTEWAAGDPKDWIQYDSAGKII